MKNVAMAQLQQVPGCQVRAFGIVINDVIGNHLIKVAVDENKWDAILAQLQNVLGITLGGVDEHAVNPLGTQNLHRFALIVFVFIRVDQDG